VRQESKHEYAGGLVSAFAGGTKRHAAIALEVSNASHAGLRGGPCRVFGSDVFVITQQSGRYADVVVTCDARYARPRGNDFVLPQTHREKITSESTAAVDRGDKLDEYRTLDSLQEYVLIDSRRRWVETYRRSEGMWIASLPVTNGDLQFASVDVTFALDAIYRGSGL